MNIPFYWCVDVYFCVIDSLFNKPYTPQLMPLLYLCFLDWNGTCLINIHIVKYLFYVYLLQVAKAMYSNI